MIAACMLSPATGWAQSDALLDDYNQYATFYAQGKYQEALPFALRLVELPKSEFGADHPTAAVLYANVADIHAEMGNLGLAEPLYRRALGILAEIERVHPLTSAVLFNNVAELFSAQGRTCGAVMPRLAERMGGEEAPPEMAPVEIVEAPEEVIVAAVEPVEDAAPSEPEMIPEEVTVGEFIEETVDTPATETTRETPLERAASEAAEVEIIVEAPEPEEAGETVIAAAEVAVEQEIEIIVVPEPEIIIGPEPEVVVVIEPEVEVESEVSTGEEISAAAAAEVSAEQEIEIIIEPETGEVTASVQNTAEPEPPVVKEAAAALEIIVEPEPEIEIVIEPEPEQVVVALELDSEPEPEPELVVEADSEIRNLAIEEESTEADAVSEEELEWAKIDSELDMPDKFDSRLPSVRPEDDGAEMRFDLAGIIVQGSLIYTARELLPVSRHYLGTEVSVSDLYSISSAISKRYASDGYAATSAVIPT